MQLTSVNSGVQVKSCGFSIVFLGLGWRLHLGCRVWLSGSHTSPPKDKGIADTHALCQGGLPSPVGLTGKGDMATGGRLTYRSGIPGGMPPVGG
jgi:hypothetical protein